MVEIRIHGRGGQGGVTLAKLIATAYFLRGKHTQAFGVYAAERSGAPLQAYVRIDDEEISNHNQVREPDHVIVLDRTLLGPAVLSGLKPDGWLLVNTPDAPDGLGDDYAGRRVATVDATATALAHRLGTRAVPIVNTAMLGAVGRVLGLPWDGVRAALDELRFKEADAAAARETYDHVVQSKRGGKARPAPAEAAGGAPAGMFDARVGAPPTIRTGSWATRAPQRRTLTPPCVHACPAGNDVRSFVAATGAHDYDRALAILLETSPLPGVCGRVCPAPCMEACNRADFDEAVHVRDLERFVADNARRPAPTHLRRSTPVAVVGSGPAGLSAAYHAARLGYPVTVFEAERELGGLMRTGIPAYRLPRDVLDAEIGYILSHGVEAVTGQRVGRTELLDLTRSYSAVFVATGLQEARALNLGPACHDLVIQGIDFLDRAARYEISVRGERVIVIGGGNTAVDAARTAVRLGAAGVRIVYRRSRAEMPAIREEVDEALEEGVTLHELASPLHVRRDAAGAVLTCGRMRLGEPDASGRRQPVPDTCEDAQFDLSCDRVILALGQGADLSILPEGSELEHEGRLLGLTAAPVFAGGDFATNDGSVAAAIGSGRRAALHIHQTLTGEDLFPPPLGPAAGPDVIRTHVFAHSPARSSPHVSALERRRSFVEVRRGYFDAPDDHPALAEAQRCFSCGVCNECDACRNSCPEGILTRDGDGYRFNYDYCKGCGVCAAQCPRGVIFMTDL